MTSADKLAPEKILDLACVHIAHYRSLISNGAANVRLDECCAYLRIWQQVMDKKGIWTMLDKEARSEIRAAIDSGEYDDLLERPA
jgi:hypothetical protein